MTQQANTTETTGASLTDLLNDPEYAELLEETTEQKAVHDMLFEGEKRRGQDKQSLAESLTVLGYDSM